MDYLTRSLYSTFNLPGLSCNYRYVEWTVTVQLDNHGQSGISPDSEQASLPP